MVNCVTLEDKTEPTAEFAESNKYLELPQL